ncbi:tRNA-dihydrouridine(16/17) synthase [NAD(P)(+)] [Monosporozyma servazzii]
MAVTKITGRELFNKLGQPSKILAPMVDHSELAWRILSRQHGCTLTYTPMLHARLFATSDKYRRDMWGSLDGDSKIDRPLVVQICGNDPEYVLQTALLVQDKCDAVDLNLGCPQGIAKKGHYGSFLMEEWDLIHKIIRTLHDKLEVPVTAKIRVFPERQKTLDYAKMILDAGAQFLTVHGRLREQKGQKTGLADWSIIKFLRDNLPSDTVMFANGNILYPEDITRCLKETGCDGVMSAEGNLYNPGVFAAEDSLDKDVSFPRVDVILREYYEIVKKVAAESPASRKTMKSHIFKILRPFLSNHTDIRSVVASMGGKATLEEWDEKVIKPVEEIVNQLCSDGEKKDDVEVGPLESWGGSYKTVPYWRCQPYFRAVNGVTGDKRQQQKEEEETEDAVEGPNESATKRRKIVDALS